MTFFAIDEIADIFGFAGHRLFDDMFIVIICAADGGIEKPQFYRSHIWCQSHLQSNATQHTKNRKYYIYIYIATLAKP